jgi:hypothetical protein
MGFTLFFVGASRCACIKDYLFVMHSTWLSPKVWLKSALDALGSDFKWFFLMATVSYKILTFNLGKI